MPVATVGGGICPTIIGDHQNRITDYTAIVVEVKKNNGNADNGGESVAPD